MKEFEIDKLDDEVYEITLKSKLDLGNNYTQEHFEGSLLSALSREVKEELFDSISALDCPSHSTLTFTYRGNFGYHSDNTDIENACKLLNEELY